MVEEGPAAFGGSQIRGDRMRENRNTSDIFGARLVGMATPEL